MAGEICVGLETNFNIPVTLVANVGNAMLISCWLISFHLVIDWFTWKLDKNLHPSSKQVMLEPTRFEANGWLTAKALQKW